MPGEPVAVTDVLGNTATTGYDQAGRPVTGDLIGEHDDHGVLDEQQDGINATVVTSPDGVATHRGAGRAGTGYPDHGQHPGRGAH